VSSKETSGNRKSRKSAAGREPRSFEQALERLEQIVERLEGGEESLDESLRLYEEAVALWRFCEERLRAAQERIEKLAREAGETVVPGEDEPEEVES